MLKLDRKKALKLIPFIVDNEASAEEKEAFFAYIQTDQVVQAEYESMMHLKQVIKHKLPRHPAPPQLRSKVHSMLRDLEWEEQAHKEIDSNRWMTDTPPGETANPSKTRFFSLAKPMRYVAAAAVILFFSILTIQFLERVMQSRTLDHYNLEQMALSHFNNRTALPEVATSSIIPASMQHAYEVLHHELSYPIHVPNVDGALMSAIYMADFVNGHHIPVFEFHQESINEHVYIFAFHVDALESSKQLHRDKEAVDVCRTDKDFHVKNIDGMHVLSWKWDGYWYAAVSNHNGYDLAALIEPDEVNFQ
ncbi:MAG: anti-sigma factor family protein [Balneolaceae bacterium]